MAVIKTRPTKRIRLTPPTTFGTEEISSSTLTAESDNGEGDAFLKAAANWNLEQNYEQRPRKKRKQDRENTRLPIKTAEGIVQQVALPVEADDDSFLGTSDEASEDEDIAPKHSQHVPQVPVQQQIIEAKEELARIAGLLNEDPEEHAGLFKSLATIASSSNTTIKKLAIATQLVIFKDVIPGYRIRPLSDTDMTVKVSKDVKRLRAFEQSLVSSYQTYVRELAKLAKGSRRDSSPSVDSSLSSVAISCACALLTTVPHFNFRGDILNILISKLSEKRPDADFIKCRTTLEELFRGDEDGTPSLDAVTALTKMLKNRSYRVDESVLNTFLHLRLLSEFSSKASRSAIDSHNEDPTKQASTRGKKVPKQKRAFLTKRERKLAKERRGIEKEFQEADATVSYEERDRMQAETLKLVFVCYFRILKARAPGLMGAVLEGLAKYAHLINQDFFGDVLEALRDLIGQAEGLDSLSFGGDGGGGEGAEKGDEEDDSTGRNASRESLLCIITAFELLRGQDVAKSANALHLDLTFFISHLYRTLFSLALNPDLELSAHSLHLPDPSPSSSSPSTTQATITTTTAQTPPPRQQINVKTTIVLLLRALTGVLLPAQSVRAVPAPRVAAFSKTIMAIALQTPEKSSIALLGLMNRVGKAHGRKIAGLWNTEERRGDGVFDALAAEPERANPWAATVWEGELLRRHFSPKVREAARGVERAIREA